jgi:hypothetical protein
VHEINQKPDNDRLDNDRLDDDRLDDIRPVAYFFAPPKAQRWGLIGGVVALLVALVAGGLVVLSLGEGDKDDDAASASPAPSTPTDVELTTRADAAAIAYAEDIEAFFDDLWKIPAHDRAARLKALGKPVKLTEVPSGERLSKNYTWAVQELRPSYEELIQGSRKVVAELAADPPFKIILTDLGEALKATFIELPDREAGFKIFLDKLGKNITASQELVKTLRLLADEVAMKPSIQGCPDTDLLVADMRAWAKTRSQIIAAQMELTDAITAESENTLKGVSGGKSGKSTFDRALTQYNRSFAQLKTQYDVATMSAVTHAEHVADYLNAHGNPDLKILRERDEVNALIPGFEKQIDEFQKSLTNRKS